MTSVESPTPSARITFTKGKFHTEVAIRPGLTDVEKGLLGQLYLWPRKVQDDREEGGTVSRMRALHFLEPGAAKITTDQLKAVFSRTRVGEITYTNPEEIEPKGIIFSLKDRLRREKK